MQKILPIPWRDFILTEVETTLNSHKQYIQCTNTFWATLSSTWLYPGAISRLITSHTLYLCLCIVLWRSVPRGRSAFEKEGFMQLGTANRNLTRCCFSGERGTSKVLTPNLRTLSNSLLKTKEGIQKGPKASGEAARVNAFKIHKIRPDSNSHIPTRASSICAAKHVHFSFFTPEAE